MNYITKLKQEIAERDARLASLDKNMREFTKFLHGPKFTGEDNGERKDWISTGDVLNWLRETQSAAIGETR